MGQTSLTWIRLIMILVCYIVRWWPSWLSDQIAFIYLFILFYFILFFYLGFTALSRTFHLYRVDCSSKVGENPGKNH